MHFYYTLLRFIHQEKIGETSSVLDTQKLKMSFSSSPLVIPVRDTGMALLHRSSEKNWQLLTKFIINSHLTVEEKICHKK